MSKRIFKKRLPQFLEVHTKNNFVNIAFDCGANELLTLAPLNNQNNCPYKFSEALTEDDSNSLWKCPIVVLYIPNHSYLMYEIKNKKILLWVCYTEKESRNNHYMTLLLQKLISIYPKKTISADTCSNELLHICTKLGIQT
ncbi:MAG: hypothetical protein EOL93_02895 [Epsilonproteobacteria bacterium]|nr:hypothetical protein [Campylobacterota bacterium]